MSLFVAEAFRIDNHHKVFWAYEESTERSVGKISHPELFPDLFK